MKNKHLINSYLKYNLLFKKLKKFIILVELKCGTTCNGILKGIDDYFNILINEVYNYIFKWRIFLRKFNSFS
jgi:small nuclear ribonucleoprotein (snRNP)-like protein